MTATIEFYYDFRSPYAYFSSHRIRNGLQRELNWIWRPISIDVLLNLQAGREPWAAYVDALCPPKRANRIVDVGRVAAYYNRPLLPPNPMRPYPIPALCLAAHLSQPERVKFSNVVFDAVWEEQQDIADHDVLQTCLARAGTPLDSFESILDESARINLGKESVEAYARGIFGVPTFVFENQVFFGDDRLDLLLWTIDRK